MQYLVDEVSTCRHSARLSRLNQPIFPYINTGSGAQALANSLSKINAYAELVRAALNTNPNNTIMQALHDVLRGTAKDLYILVSSYCLTDCCQAIQHKVASSHLPPKGLLILQIAHKSPLLMWASGCVLEERIKTLAGRLAAYSSLKSPPLNYKICSLQLSPTYCVDCIDMPQCSFTIPRLAATSLFLPTCNLVSYISSTIIFELLGIELLTVGRGMGPLPDTQQWLSTHVREDSPAYNLLP